MEAYLAEKTNLKVVAGPVDLNTAAVTGERVSMKNCARVAFIVQLGDSTSATKTFTLRQHNAASSGTSKNLSVDNPYYIKKDAETVFTKVEPVAAAAAYDLSAVILDTPGVVVFEVLAEQLDTALGFAWVSLDITDSAAALLGTVLAVQHGLASKPGYSQAV